MTEKEEINNFNVCTYRGKYAEFLWYTFRWISDTSSYIFTVIEHTEEDTTPKIYVILRRNRQNCRKIIVCYRIHSGAVCFLVPDFTAGYEWRHRRVGNSKWRHPAAGTKIQIASLFFYFKSLPDGRNTWFDRWMILTMWWSTHYRLALITEFLFREINSKFKERRLPTNELLRADKVNLFNKARTADVFFANSHSIIDYHKNSIEIILQVTLP